MGTVSDQLKGNLAVLNSLLSSGALASHEDEVPLRMWRDELGRLRVWAANIGAHQTGQSSLEYRLRDASHVRGQTLKLLTRLRELLADLTAVLDESTDDELEECAVIGLDEMEDTTEIQQIYQSLRNIITNLFQLSMVIRAPAHHDRLLGTDKLDAEPFRFWTKQHVSHKFPLADELIIDRLSGAMAKQRAILKYHERHHAKMS